MKQRCIGYGKYEGKCFNDVGTKGPWCMRCNEIRIAFLTERIEEMENRMSARTQD